MKKLKLVLILQLIFLSSYSQEWENVGNGLDGFVYDLISFEGNLFAGGNLGTGGEGVFYWDGENWNSTNTLWGINTPLTFEVFQGDLYTSGDFNGSNGNPTKVFKWENGDWIQQGEEFIWGDWNSVKKLKAHEDFLYAGGMFDNVGVNQPAKNIARWDGNVWQNVGEGIPTIITEMDVFQSKFAVCHQILDTTYYNIFRRKIQLWDNNQWEDLDSIFDYQNVNMLRVIDDKLYFQSNDTINNIPVINLGYWDGNTITSIGDTLFHYVSDVYEFDNELYAACQIKLTNSSNPMHVIRKFDGENWILVGGIFTQSILTLHEHDNRLYAGGFFGYPNNDLIRFIARLTNSTSAFEIEKKPKVEIFPNPTNSKVKIISQNSPIKRFNLHSLEGGLLISEENINSKVHSLELGKFPAGTYFVEIITSDNVKFTQKLIKY